MFQPNLLRTALSWLVAFIPATFPLYLIRLEIFNIPFSLPELLIWLAVFVFAVLLFTRKVHFFLSPTAQGFTVALILLTALFLFNVPTNFEFEGNLVPTLRHAFGIWKEWIVAPSFYMLLIIQTMTSADWQTQLKRFFLLGSAGLALYALWLGNYSYDQRLVAHFANPNYLALYLAPGFSLALLELVSRAKFLRIESLVYFLVIGTALMLTRSYGAFLSIFCVSVFYTFRNLQGRYRWWLLGILLLCVGGVLFMEIGSDKLAQTFDFVGRSSSSVRLQIWQVAFGLWEELPIFGVGLGMFQVYYWREAWEILGQAPLEWNVLHTHNLYLHWLTETGIVGLLLFLGWIWTLMRRRPIFPDVDLRWILAVLLVYGLFDLPFWKNDLALEFFMLAGLITAGHHIIRGTVFQGSGLTKKAIGVPTLNLNAPLLVHEHLDGLYACWVYWQGQRVAGILLSGESAIPGKEGRRLEAYLFNLSTDLRGEKIFIQPVAFLRESKSFVDIQALKDQLLKDHALASKILHVKNTRLPAQ